MWNARGGTSVRIAALAALVMTGVPVLAAAASDGQGGRANTTAPRVTSQPASSGGLKVETVELNGRTLILIERTVTVLEQEFCCPSPNSEICVTLYCEPDEKVTFRCGDSSYEKVCGPNP